MSIAWGGLVLIILLLPGVLFFVGLYFPEQFTRETVERSPFGQLAAVLLVSFFVHGLLYCTLISFCGRVIPCISVKVLLDTIALDASVRGATSAISANVEAFRWWILFYVLATCVSGILAGWGVGLLVIHKRLKSLTQHTWIYDLSVGDNFTVAYVMTHVRDNGRVLMYRGFLKAFGLQRDGRCSYIVLTDAVRGYLHLEATGPRTSGKSEWRSIGHTTGRLVGPLSGKTLHTRRDRSYFAIEGEDIANAVFDRLAFDYDKALQDLRPLIAELQSDFQETLQKRPVEMPVPPPSNRGVDDSPAN